MAVRRGRKYAASRKTVKDRRERKQKAAHAPLATNKLSNATHRLKDTPTTVVGLLTDSECGDQSGDEIEEVSHASRKPCYSLSVSPPGNESHGGPSHKRGRTEKSRLRQRTPNTSRQAEDSRERSELEFVGERRRGNKFARNQYGFQVRTGKALAVTDKTKVSGPFSARMPSLRHLSPSCYRKNRTQFRDSAYPTSPNTALGGSYGGNQKGEPESVPDEGLGTMLKRMVHDRTRLDTPHPADANITASEAIVDLEYKPSPRPRARPSRIRPKSFIKDDIEDRKDFSFLKGHQISQARNLISSNFQFQGKVNDQGKEASNIPSSESKDIQVRRAVCRLKEKFPRAIEDLCDMLIENGESLDAILRILRGDDTSDKTDQTRIHGFRSPGNIENEHTLARRHSKIHRDGLDRHAFAYADVKDEVGLNRVRAMVNEPGFDIDNDVPGDNPHTRTARHRYVSPVKQSRPKTVAGKSTGFGRIGKPTSRTAPRPTASKSISKMPRANTGRKRVTFSTNYAREAEKTQQRLSSDRRQVRAMSIGLELTDPDEHSFSDWSASYTDHPSEDTDDSPSDDTDDSTSDDTSTTTSLDSTEEDD